MGQYHQSCRDSVSKLLENHAILISSSSKLSHNIIALYNDFNLRNKMGDNARRVLKQNSQSLAGNYSIINKFLRP
jgi:3-deoxy-D-manno-octulosonic-acid transferase